ncbi:MAG: hypothetical protein H6623_03910 [Bdellovibrionaceae bacterium]|nr:hypothetical protein [Pseudobdellovibrionaceae bacterium]
MRYIFFNIFICSLVTACSSQKVSSSGDRVQDPAVNNLEQKLQALTTQNCVTASESALVYLQTLNLQKMRANEMHKDFFDLRLLLKEKFTSLDVDPACSYSVSHLYSELRKGEETWGYNQKIIEHADVLKFSVQPVFTDSFHQLLSNSKTTDEVTSLTDLRSGDIILMFHLDSIRPETAPLGDEWTSVAVVLRGEDEELSLLEYDGQRIQRHRLSGSQGWLKRGVARTAVLRLKNEQDFSHILTAWKGKTLKDELAFVRFIQKEFHLKSKMISASLSDVLTAEFELNANLNILSEWKNYVGAFQSRILVRYLQLLAPPYQGLTPSETRGLAHQTLADKDAILQSYADGRGRDRLFSKFSDLENDVGALFHKVEKSAQRNCHEWSNARILMHIIDGKYSLCAEPIESGSVFIMRETSSAE